VNSSVRLGRIAGIEVGVNWSWLLVFGLLVWSLATSVFPSESPDRSDRTYWIMAIVAAVFFFAALLAHELGHALQARRDGMEIDGITLWLFGGVARFRGSFPSAGAEFRIAIAGPLVSLVLGVGFVLAALFVPLPDEVEAVSIWLGFINLFLLVFNLLPALPLDGGRVLRSALWRIRGDFTWATRIAATLGRLFALLFIAGGIALAVWDDTYSGLWLVLIGWFLLNAAGAEARQLDVRAALAGLRVQDLMVRSPVTVRADVPLDEFARAVAGGRAHATYPVVEDGRVVGLLPFPERAGPGSVVRDAMIPADRVPVLAPGTDVADALDQLARAGVGLGVVLDGDRLVGFVASADLARALELREALPA
jgi:Zn-dependent protease